MAANACGDTGLVFEDYTKLSMEYLHDGTVNGLLIAYSGDGRVSSTGTISIPAVAASWATWRGLPW